MRHLYIESYEVEKLEKLIQSKKDYLKRLKSDWTRKKVQEEIMFLEKYILPIAQAETMLLYSEYSNYVQRKINEAVQLNCDAIVLFLPLTDEVKDTALIGVANPKEYKVGENNIDSIEVGIDSMGIHGKKIDAINLPL